MPSTSALDAWAALVAAAREYSRLAFADEPVALTIHLARCRPAKLPLPASCQGDLTPEPAEPTSEQVGGTIAQRIIQALTDEPQTPERIARLSECTFNSHFRRVITELTRQGLAIRTPDGIKIAAGRSCED